MLNITYNISYHEECILFKPLEGETSNIYQGYLVQVLGINHQHATVLLAPSRRRTFFPFFLSTARKQSRVLPW